MWLTVSDRYLEHSSTTSVRLDLPHFPPYNFSEVSWICRTKERKSLNSKQNRYQAYRCNYTDPPHCPLYPGNYPISSSENISQRDSRLHDISSFHHFMVRMLAISPTSPPPLEEDWWILSRDSYPYVKSIYTDSIPLTKWPDVPDHSTVKTTSWQKRNTPNIQSTSY